MSGRSFSASFQTWSVHPTEGTASGQWWHSQTFRFSTKLNLFFRSSTSWIKSSIFEVKRGSECEHQQSSWEQLAPQGQGRMTLTWIIYFGTWQKSWLSYRKNTEHIWQQNNDWWFRKWQTISMRVGSNKVNMHMWGIISKVYIYTCFRL